MNLPENILMQQEQESKHSYVTVKSNLTKDLFIVVLKNYTTKYFIPLSYFTHLLIVIPNLSVHMYSVKNTGLEDRKYSMKVWE
jgi:hypothetical protein